MITTLLLVIIYLAFISLGLPDGLFGVTLPVLAEEWGLSLSLGGLFSMTVSGFTILSSFLSGHMIKRFGTGVITFVSCVMTGGALLGFSLMPSFGWFFLLAIPFGLGAGTVDSALNHFVALNYKARHMNWLHSFWGLGATIGPLVMSWAMTEKGSWRLGYRSLSTAQLSLAVVLLLSLPLWKKVLNLKGMDKGEAEGSSGKPEVSLWKLPGLLWACLVFVLYCTVEFSGGLWGASFLVGVRGYTPETAAHWIALYYGGITLGRVLSGFISIYLDNIGLIRYGGLLAIVGCVLLFLPFSGWFTGAAFVLLGLGLSPIFPAMVHETPRRFGEEWSGVIIGYQMGFAYGGVALMPPVIALILEYISLSLYPWLMVVFAFLMFLSSEVLNRRAGVKGRAEA